MGALNPVDMLLLMGAGEPVTISLMTAADSSAYDSTSSTPFAPGAPTTITTAGIWSDDYQENQPQECIATVTAPATPVLTGIRDNQSKLTRGSNGKVYTIIKVRNRVWMGEQSGYTLFLGA